MTVWVAFQKITPWLPQPITIMQPIEPVTKYDIFISHSHQDGKLVKDIYTYLESRGLKCWVSSRVEDNPGGAKFKAEIARLIAAIPIFILVLTENANASDDVASETSIAYENKKCIIPFNPFKIKFSGSFNYDLTGKNHVGDFEGSFQEQLERLYFSCASHLRQQPVPTPKQSIVAIIKQKLQQTGFKRLAIALLIILAGWSIWTVISSTLTAQKKMNNQPEPEADRPVKSDSLLVSGIVRQLNHDKGIPNAWVTSNLTPGDTIITTSDGTFEIKVKAEPGQSIRMYAGAKGYNTRDEYHTLPKAIDISLKKEDL